MGALIYLFIILAAGLIILGIRGLPEARPHIVALPREEIAEKKLNIRRIIAFLVPMSQKIVEKMKLDAKLKGKLGAAHVNLTPPEFFSLKLLLIPFIGVLAFFTLGKLELPVLVAVLGLGYIVPDLLINKKIAKRKSEIARLLPETIDLLGLCVEAGLDFTSSVRWIIEKTPSNPIMEELKFVLEEIKWGKPRLQALKDMAKRLNIPEVSSFVQTLVQAERMGTPVAEAFAILSEDARLQRFHRGERFALQAPIKILIPLIFCILPVIGIVVGGPIFLQFMSGGLLQGMK